MSSSFIPPRGPDHVRLTPDGQRFWENWGRQIPVQALDVYDVKADIDDDPDYLIFSQTSGQGLWVPKNWCTQVRKNDAGEWEEVT